MPRVPKVAIACQGGGSHAAFAAGVLQRLLARDLRERYELVGLSGTSGGAMCAALAWTGLHLGGPVDALGRLAAFWDDVKADDLLDSAANFWGVWAARLPVSAEVSPYLHEPIAEQTLVRLVQRHIPLAQIPGNVRDGSRLKLLVGATDVLSGERTVFGSNTITERHLIASAAVPPIFRAIDIGGRYYWDGLFTSNPPVRELTDEEMMAVKPDEIWVIQINPQHRSEEPRLMSDIVDRRNELSGNLALSQELYFIDKVNDLVARFPDLARKYKHIEVKVVEMSVPRLDYASKLDRSPSLIETLMNNGRELGDRFLGNAKWPDSGSIPKGNVCLP